MTVSWWFLSLFAICIFFLSIYATAPLLYPEKYEFDFYDFIGWLFFIAAITSWEIAR